MNSSQIRSLLDELDQLDVVLTGCSLNTRSRTAITSQICEMLQEIALGADEMQLYYRSRDARTAQKKLASEPIKSLERKIQIEK